jgi:hypothetical protein
MKNGDRDTRWVFVIAVVASVVAFIHYFRQNEILMYGDAVAHINIARRVFDSRSPGLDQLGTVWLPLPHLLTIPFILNDWMWRTGVGGSIASMIAYVAGVIGMFRLVRDNLRGHRRGRLAAWIATLVYALNPNLLYMQATAMTESLSLAFFVWAVVFFADFVREYSHPCAKNLRKSGAPDDRRAERSLWWCALMLSGEMLTRYDGWFAACVMAAVLFGFLSRQRSRTRVEGKRTPGIGDRESGINKDENAAALHDWKVETGNWKLIFARFVVLIAIVPIFWFTYNYRLFGNPLEFATGPYSARAIAERTSRPGEPPYPGKNHPGTAALYFVKSGALNLAGYRLEGEYGHWWRRTWQQDGWWFLLAAGSIALISLRAWPLLLLWIPLPFYALSIAYGGVPIFIPSWWPFSYYNVRYGLQLLPLAAACVAAVVVAARWPKAIATGLIVFTAITYLGTWRTDPICLREAKVNSRAREQLETRLAQVLAALPHDATILMYTGEHVGALQRAGIPLRRSINENNYYAWRDALRSPATMADYAVTFGDDDVSKAVRADPRFVASEKITVEKQPPAMLYARVAR